MSDMDGIIYKCFHKGCGKEFQSLAGLEMHKKTEEHYD